MNTVAQPPQSDGKQPAGEAQSSRRTTLAAPFPHPQAHPSQAAAATQAMSAVTRVPPFPIPPEASAFEVEQRFREAFADPCLSAQMAMGIS